MGRTCWRKIHLTNIKYPCPRIFCGTPLCQAKKVASGRLHTILIHNIHDTHQYRVSQDINNSARPFNRVSK
jgi:hypothetical protein